MFVEHLIYIVSHAAGDWILGYKIDILLQQVSHYIIGQDFCSRFYGVIVNIVTWGWTQLREQILKSNLKGQVELRE